jgi:hypothetical protein
MDKSDSKYFSNYFILRHSEEHIDDVVASTDKFFEDNPEHAQIIESHVLVFHSVMDLIPATVDNFWSGNLFPYTEAEYELNSSIYFATHGFYKHALNSLRSVLELGLLSVYWDIEHQSHIEIQEWLKSKEDTPFRRQVKRRLLENKNIKSFDDEGGFFNQLDDIYNKLSSFTHTKGARYSSKALSISNYNTFNEKSLKYWVQSLQKVIRLVMILHILKYPVAYQYTPIDEKFGLNGPVGGFLNPQQVQRVKEIFDEKTNTLLQKISDADPEAIELAQWVQSFPDITEEEFEQQSIDHDKQLIPHYMGGFPKWLEDQKKILDIYDQQNIPEAKARLEKHIAIITQWAIEGNYSEG